MAQTLYFSGFQHSLSTVRFGEVLRIVQETMGKKKYYPNPKGNINPQINDNLPINIAPEINMKPSTIVNPAPSNIVNPSPYMK